MATSTLHVFWNDTLVGRLGLDAKQRFEFQYGAGWKGAPISVSLPVQPDPFRGDDARPFFNNLLPEGDVRKAIAREKGISDRNDYKLLELIAGDCAGALTLLPAGQTPKKSGAPAYRPLDADAIAALVHGRPAKSVLAAGSDLRLSLAGAQDKIPVFAEGRSFFLPENAAAASTHILKLPIAGYEQTVENEAFCMRLASQIGLPVAPVWIVTPSARAGRLLLVERFDRARSGRRVLRLHQEDFCQALGILSEHKYQNEGGPSLKQCFEVTRAVSVDPATDVRNLLHWTCFNFLTGNADAHGKNVSLLIADDGTIRLTPFYDLLSTAVYENLSPKMAMKIGSEYAPSEVSPRKWGKLAEETGLGARYVRDELRATAERLTTASATLREAFVAEFGKTAILDAIVALIAKRASKILRY